MGFGWGPRLCILTDLTFGAAKPWKTPECSTAAAAVAAAKSLQLCPTLRPHRRQPTRLPRPWDSPGKNTGVGCHFLLQCMKVKSEREVAQSCLTLATPQTAAYQAPPSMGFSRQEYWSGMPLPCPPECSGLHILTNVGSPQLPIK